MAEEQLISTKLFRFINEHDRSVLYRTKNRDNFSNNYFHYSLSSEDINRSLTEFNRVYGTVNSGIRVSLDSSNPHFKIYTDIRITKSYWNKVHNLVNLLNDEARALLVYINGKKIPDNVIKVFGSVNGTDIFIPYSHINLDAESIDVFIEDTLFRDKEYIHYYTKYLTDALITINLTGLDNYFDYNTFDQNKLLVYKNGYLDTTSFKATVNEKKKQIVVNLSQDSLMNEIEIFYNHFIAYRKSKVAINQGTEFYYQIDKEYQSALRGVIPKRSCAFYKSGLRIPNNQVEQLFRNGFVVKYDTVSTAGSLEMYIQDADLSNNRFYTSYDSDYYLQGMIGVDRLFDGIKTGKSGSIFDEFPQIDYNKICNKNHTMYDDKLADDYIYKSVYDEAAVDNYKLKTIELLKRNPSLAREFIKAFSRTVTTYVVANKGEDILLGAKTIPEDGNELFFSIYLNWKYLDDTQYSFTKVNNVYTIRIPKEFLQKGNNTIEVNENQRKINSNKVKYLEFNVSDIQAPDNKDCKGTLVVPRAAIEAFTNDLSHILILKPVDGVTSFLYPSQDLKKGYDDIKDYEIDITESNYRFNFKTLPEGKFLIYFRNFSYSSKILYDKDGSGDLDLRVFIYDGPLSDPVPIIPLGIPELHVNGEYYIYGLDYQFSTCVDSEIMAGSVISFTRRPSKGDVISIHFTGIGNKRVFETPKSFEYNSKYGLIYFSALEFPYSPDYLDLYIDSRKVFKTDIDILSDKLIRVRNIPVPFRDVYLETKFNIDYEKLRFIFDAYEEDEFENVLKLLFRRLDPSDRTVETKYTLPDDLYLDWEDDVGELIGPKEENPKNESEVIDRSDFLVTMYMKWLVSNEARSVMFNDRYLSNKVFDYFKIYQIELLENNIVIVGNVAAINAQQDYHMDCNLPNISTSKRMQVIIDTMRKEDKKDILYEDLWKLFINSKASNLILPNDFPIERDKDGLYKGTDSDIIYFKENELVPLKVDKTETKKVKLNLSRSEAYAYVNTDIFVFIDTDGELNIESTDNGDLTIRDLTDKEYGRYLQISSIQHGDYDIMLTSTKKGYETTTKRLKIGIQPELYITTPNTEKISIMRETSAFFEVETNSEAVVIEKVSGIDAISIAAVSLTKFEVTGIMVGNAAVLTKVYERSGKYKFVQINFEVYEQPYTELDFLPVKANPYDDSYSTVKLITNAPDDAFKASVYTVEPLFYDDDSNTIQIAENIDKPYIHIDEGDIEIAVDDTKKLILLSSLGLDAITITTNDETLGIEKKEENTLPLVEIIKRDGQSFDIVPNTACTGEIRVETKAHLHLPIAKNIKFETRERKNTILESDIKELTINETYSKSFGITTNAEIGGITTSYEPNDKNYITVKYSKTEVTVTGNEPGNTVLKIDAVATDMRLRHLLIPITINSIGTTTINSSVNTISMFKDETFEFEITSNADSIQNNRLGYINLNIEKLAEKTDDGLNRFKLTVNSIGYGKQVLIITSTATDLKTHSIEIPLEVKQKPLTQLDLETGLVNMTKNEEKRVIIQTNALTFTAESSDPSAVKVDTDIANKNIILTALKSNIGIDLKPDMTKDYVVITITAQAEDHVQVTKTINVSVEKLPETYLETNVTELNVLENSVETVTIKSYVDNITIDDSGLPENFLTYELLTENPNPNETEAGDIVPDGKTLFKKYLKLTFNTLKANGTMKIKAQEAEHEEKVITLNLSVVN